MSNCIGMNINNGRVMLLTQQNFDGSIRLSTSEVKSGKVEQSETISAGDMVMLINYYHYCKRNNKEIL